MGPFGAPSPGRPAGCGTLRAGVNNGPRGGHPSGVVELAAIELTDETVSDQEDIRLRSSPDDGHYHDFRLRGSRNSAVVQAGRRGALLLTQASMMSKLLRNPVRDDCSSDT